MQRSHTNTSCDFSLLISSFCLLFIMLIILKRGTQLNHPCQGSQKLRLLCSAIDFGFGPIGKLDSILSLLPCADITLIGGQIDHMENIAGRHYKHISSVADASPSDFDAALVILDPFIANQLTQIGIPVVYVDSLSHVWGTEDTIPYDVAAYCVQKFGDTDVLSMPALEKVRRLIPIDAILLPTKLHRGTSDYVLVNVGGLHLPGRHSYLYSNIIVPELTKFLVSEGMSVRVVGNLPRNTAKLLPPNAFYGSVTHKEMRTMLAECRFLVTSPGMTTMLEAGAANVPTILLPPQNVSQVLNAHIVTGSPAPHAARIDWPSSIVDGEEVRRLARCSEDAALMYMRDRFLLFSQTVPLDLTWFRRSLVLALLTISSDWLNSYVRRVGFSGAMQVADKVVEIATGSVR